MRQLVYYVAVSLDGFIAAPDGAFDAFPMEGDHLAAIAERFPDTLPTAFAEQQGIVQPRAPFDTVVMGWNTYDVGLSAGVTSPYSHLRQVVFSRSRTSEGENLTVTADDPVEVVRGLKAEPGGDIWLCGGGALAGALADEIDRLILKVNPVLFGAGIPLIAGGRYDPAAFRPAASTAYESGVVIAEYERVRPAA